MVTSRDAWKLIGILALCYVGVQIILALMLLSFRSWFGIDTLVLLNALSLLIILLLPTLVYGLAKGWNLREAFRLHPASWQVIAATVLGTFALGLAVSQVVLWLVQLSKHLPLLEHSEFINLLSAISRTKSPVLLLIAIMLPAFPEELVFRGVIQQGFEKRYTPAGAIVLTSLIFALFHLDPIQGLIVTVIALFWGWVVWRAQSILPSLIAHALQNGLTIISVLITAAQKQEGVFEPLQLQSVEPYWAAAVGGLLFWFAMVIILTRCLPKRGEKDGSTANRTHTDQVRVANGNDGGRSSELDERSGLEG